ncbi:hypothetical protein LWI29_029856 [Acer saccharum]|uniref:PGG domain-containing protein n=1 Tax=Acer saccharum TaxID=4024 RepID=A0AA39RTG5_ACESA|nr:hypothetical protein LWI29_029856 [Acer saccharum]
MEREEENAVAAQNEQNESEVEIVVSPRPLSDVTSRNRRVKLYRAAFNGKWETATDIYAGFPDDISGRITERGDTALHIAAIGQNISFVKQLVNRMREEDLTSTNEDGHTAFFLAAASSNVDLCKIMLEKNEDLAMIRDWDDMLPLHFASLSGHKHMTRYLYRLTRPQLNYKDRAQLLVNCTSTDLYDIALDLVDTHPETSIGRGRNEETALHVLAGKHLPSLDLNKQNQRGILKSCFNTFSSMKKGRSKLYSQALQLTRCIWEKVMLMCDDSEISDLIGNPRKLIFDAAKVGNVEFLSILISDYPSLIWERNDSGHSIFHVAVEHRQNEIFELLRELGSSKDFIFARIDNYGNILHLAARLGHPSRLNNLSEAASGTALLMQQELLWFKAVEMIVRPGDAKAKNNNDETPWELFVREHEELKLRGEGWMERTSNSLMVVATLIATMVFTAVLTIPGGNKGDTGVPVFNQQLSFKIFAISVAISLFSSLTSILTFISIHTSSYEYEKFLWQLPLKLMYGLLALFISVASMMVVFCTTFSIIFHEGLQGFAFSLNIIASVVVLLFIRQQYRLFIDALRLTFNPLSYFYQKPVLLR